MKKLVILLIIFLNISCQTNDKQQDDLSKAKSLLYKKIAELLPDKRDNILSIHLVKHGDIIILKGKTDSKKIKEALLQSFKSNRLQVIDSIQILPGSIFKNKIGITRLSVANLRAKPSHTSELVTQSLMGTPLQIFQSENDFFQVKTPEGYYAWVDNAGITVINKNDYKNWLQYPKVIVTANDCTVFQKPELGALPVSDAVFNNVFILLEYDEPFSKIQYPDGRTGYILSENILKMQEFTATNKLYATPEDLIQTSKSFLGVPYLWGGSSSKAFDCSGFTKTVYANFGYLLPRDASQQAKVGKIVEITDDFKNLAPGDLLFFGKKRDGKNKISHVALYIGKGKIIHATGEVKIESLIKTDRIYNDYRRKTLLLVKRVFRNYPQVLDTFYIKKRVADNHNS